MTWTLIFPHGKLHIAGTADWVSGMCRRFPGAKLAVGWI